MRRLAVRSHIPAQKEIQLMLSNMRVIVAGIYNKNDEEAEAVKARVHRSLLFT